MDTNSTTSIVVSASFIGTMISLIVSGMSSRRSALGRRVDDLNRDIQNLLVKVAECERDRASMRAICDELREQNLTLLQRLASFHQ